MKSIASLLLFTIFFYINLFPSQSRTQKSNIDSKVDKSSILNLLQNRLFESLEVKLKEYQEAYERDYQEEDHLFDAFDVFSKPDTAFELTLNDWAKQFAGSYVPYIARARYYCSRAWQARGNKWSIDKDEKEYKEIEMYFSLATIDIDNALSKNSRLDVCYEMMIEIGTATGNEDLKDRALIAALKNHPYAYRIRMKYLHSLTPRWGGSYQRMEQFIDTSEKYAEFNPKLKELSASVPADKGSVFSYLGKYGHAVKMYTEALKYSDHHSYYADRADAYCRLKDYASAIRDYERALELSPNDPDYLRRKSNAIFDRNRASKITRTMKQAERPSTSDQQIHDQRESDRWKEFQSHEHAQKASEFARAGKFQEAVTEISEAIRLAPEKYTFYYNRAMYYQQLHNEEAALQDLLRVIERKKDEADAYVRVTLIYANRGMYEDALNYINTAISIKPDNAEAVFYRARIYENKGWNVEALEEMRKACDMGYERACRQYKQVR